MLSAVMTTDNAYRVLADVAGQEVGYSRARVKRLGFVAHEYDCVQCTMPADSLRRQYAANKDSPTACPKVISSIN